MVLFEIIRGFTVVFWHEPLLESDFTRVRFCSYRISLQVICLILHLLDSDLTANCTFAQEIQIYIKYDLDSHYRMAQN